MNQTLFVAALTLLGTAGVFLVEPFLGVWVYYLFAVLRPQHMWEWALPADYNWSRYVALATMLALIAGVAKIRQSGHGRPQVFSTAHKWMAGFGVWLLLCYLFAPFRNPAWTDVVALEYLKIFLMFFCATLLIGRLQQIWSLFVMIGIVLAYIAYEMNYLYLVNRLLTIATRGYAGLDNNGAALMLAMGVPVCLFLWEGMRRWYRWAFLAFIPVIIHAVLMSYSRGAMLSLVVASPLWLLRSRQRVRLGLIYGAVVVFLLPVLAGSEIKARFFSIEQHEVDDSVNSRRAAWSAAIQMANENPIFGLGLRCANLFSHQYGADVEGRTIHSQYLQIAADNGWVGLGFYLMVLGAAWSSLRRARRLLAGRDDEEARKARAMASGLEGSMAVFCVGAAFLSLEVVELPFLLLLLMMQLPLVTGVVRPTEPLPQDRRAAEAVAPAEAGAGDRCTPASPRPQPIDVAS